MFVDTWEHITHFHTVRSLVKDITVTRNWVTGESRIVFVNGAAVNRIDIQHGQSISEFMEFLEITKASIDPDADGTIKYLFKMRAVDAHTLPRGVKYCEA